MSFRSIRENKHYFLIHIIPIFYMKNVNLSMGKQIQNCSVMEGIHK